MARPIDNSLNLNMEGRAVYHRLARGLTLLFLLLLAGCSKPAGPVQPGSALPVIKTEGWLNGPPPVLEELQGQVVVIHAWAYW